MDVAVKRLLTARFALGEMDEPEKVSWTGIPFSVVASAGHDSLALDMARKSMTLLMNKDNTLPLKRGGLTIAVMGPNANDSVMQWGIITVCLRTQLPFWTELEKFWGVMIGLFMNKAADGWRELRYRASSTVAKLPTGNPDLLHATGIT